MDVLFTDTSVLLNEDFVKSIAKENLECKLEKLRLVCDTRYINVDNTYALCGKWEHVDAAFQILAHWQEQQDHEPSINVLKSGTVVNLCNCKAVRNVFGPKCINKQTESESRTLDDDNTLHKNWDELISCLIKEKNQTESEDVSKIKKIKRLRKIKRKVPTANCIDEDGKHSLASNLHQPDLSANEDEASKELKSNCCKDSVEGTNNVLDIYPEVDLDDAVKQNDLQLDDLKENEKVKEKSSEENVHKQTVGDKRYWSRVKRTDGDVAHQCTKCDVVLKSRKRYLEHLRRIHIKEYRCEVCNKGFGYPTDLKRHTCRKTDGSKKTLKKKSVKKSTVSFSCAECNYVTTSNSRLQNHVTRTHSLNYKCDQCDKKFGFSAELEKHKYNMHTEKLFFCDQCAKCYKNKQGFDAHLKTHGSNYVKPSFVCDMCSKSFTTSYSLAMHVKSEHFGVKKVYLCQICGKKFSQRNSYRQHCNAHNGIKPYKCNKCDKEFVYHKSLKEHQFMHDNIRRFRCTICDKAFRQRTVLHIHMKTHKAEKDHRCSVCGRGFSQKQAMERHERIHSGVRPYTCQLCKKSFGDTSTIRRHMMALHKKTEMNWRDNVASAMKKKSDHYVFGGSGQNRTYKSNTKQQESAENDVPYSQNVSDAVPKTQASLTDTSFVVINSGLNSAQGSKINNVVNGTANLTGQNLASHPQIQLSTLYAITANHQQPLQQNPDNGTTIPSIQLKNNLQQVFDFSNMTLVATKLPQTLINKADNNENIQQQLQGDNGNMIQAAALLPVSGLTGNMKQNSGEIISQNTGDPGVAQTIWGFVGYPSNVNTDNFTQFQSQ